MKEQKTILVHSATAHPNMEQVRQHQDEGWLVTHSNNTLNYVIYIVEREKPVAEESEAEVVTEGNNNEVSDV